MTRVLEPELLDELPATDPRAIHSRRDLRRINALMGNARPIIRFVEDFLKTRAAKSPLVIAEIGAGDGNVSSQVARAIARRNVVGDVFLVDREPLKASRAADWKMHLIKADIFDWLTDAPSVDVIIANLFLHHFTDQQVRTMFQRCAERCDCFAASEPRRSPMAEWFSRRVGLIGCNEVTKHDAEISVRAGFNGSELSILWPASEMWRIQEGRVGLFTHFFGAVRAQ
jgi:hypothetical protein